MSVIYDFLHKQGSSSHSSFRDHLLLSTETTGLQPGTQEFVPGNFGDPSACATRFHRRTVRALYFVAPTNLLAGNWSER
jgi:hypothetical protein